MSEPIEQEPAEGQSWRRKGRQRKESKQGEATLPRSEIFIPFTPGSIVRVRYQGPGTASSNVYALNIYSGDSIALHFNPRPSAGVLVLNSHLGGAWGPEERPEGYPLHHKGEIALSLWASPDGFVIQARTAGSPVPFYHLYAYRHPESCKLDRMTVHLPDVRALLIQPEL